MSITGSASIRPSSIRRIHIDQLFGYLTYTIPSRRPTHANFDRLIILYGDNGAGKTAILRLIFSILAPNQGRGDKTFVYRTPFRSIEIEFDNRLIIRADRTGSALRGDYRVTIRQPDRSEQTFPVSADANVGAVRATQKVRRLLAALSDLGISLYFLPDDRRVRSTFSDDLNIDPIGEEGSTTTIPADVFRRAWATGTILAQSGQAEEAHHLNIEPVLNAVNT